MFSKLAIVSMRSLPVSLQVSLQQQEPFKGHIRSLLRRAVSIWPPVLKSLSTGADDGSDVLYWIKVAFTGNKRDIDFR